MGSAMLSFAGLSSAARQQKCFVYQAIRKNSSTGFKIQVVHFERVTRTGGYPSGGRLFAIVNTAEYCCYRTSLGANRDGTESADIAKRRVVALSFRWYMNNCPVHFGLKATPQGL
jgi:hypothetical protein